MNMVFPFPLQLLLATEPRVLGEVLAVVQRGISTFLIRRSGHTVAPGARTGAVTLIQRFGSALNLNPHLHMLWIESINRLFRQSGGYQEAQTRDRFALNPRQTSHKNALRRENPTQPTQPEPSQVSSPTTPAMTRSLPPQPGHVSTR